MPPAPPFSFKNDLAELSAKLMRPPSGPAFTVPDSRFLQIVKTERSRRGIQRLIRPENCAPILAALPRGEGARLHVLLRGDFVVCDLIAAIIEAHGPASSVHIATLSMSGKNARQLADLSRRGLIGDLNVVVSHYFAKIDKKEIFPEVVAALDGIARLTVTRTHCKVFTITTPETSWVIEGSANLRSSDNLKQIVIFDDPDLLAFHADWMASLSAP
jgi:hypothetical protein